jgi:hypothetical protein
VVRADSDETVVVKAHMRTDRLEMLERVSDEDLRGWIQDE